MAVTNEYLEAGMAETNRDGSVPVAARDASVAYTHDANGNLLTITRTLVRSGKVWVTTMTYDANGNILTKSALTAG